MFLARGVREIWWCQKTTLFLLTFLHTFAYVDVACDPPHGAPVKIIKPERYLRSSLQPANLSGTARFQKDYEASEDSLIDLPSWRGGGPL